MSDRTEYDCTAIYANGVEMNISSKHPGGTKWIGENGWIFVTRGETTASAQQLFDFNGMNTDSLATRAAAMVE